MCMLNVYLIHITLELICMRMFYRKWRAREVDKISNAPVEAKLLSDPCFTDKFKDQKFVKLENQLYFKVSQTCTF